MCLPCQHGVTPVASVCTHMCTACSTRHSALRSRAPWLSACVVAAHCAQLGPSLVSCQQVHTSSPCGQAMSQFACHKISYMATSRWPLPCGCGCLQQAASIEAATSCTEDGCNSCRVCMPAGMVTLPGGIWLNRHWLLTRSPDQGDVDSTKLHFLMQMCALPRLVSFGLSTKWSQGLLHAVLCFGNAACLCG